MKRSLAILMPVLAMSLVSCAAPKPVHSDQPEIPVLSVLNDAPVLSCRAIVYAQEGNILSSFRTTVGKGKEFDTGKTIDDVYVYDVGSDASTNVAGTRLVIERSTLRGTILVFNWDGSDIANGVVQCNTGSTK